MITDLRNTAIISNFQVFLLLSDDIKELGAHLFQEALM